MSKQLNEIFSKVTFESVIAKEQDSWLKTCVSELWQLYIDNEKKIRVFTDANVGDIIKAIYNTNKERIENEIANISEKNIENEIANVCESNENNVSVQKKKLASVNNYLYIKKITFENWAQYDDLKIEFPLPNDENAEIPVFYFLGNNGAGKTRIFQGVRVALFGKSAIERDPNSFDMFDLFPNEKKIEISKVINAGNNYPPQTTSLTVTFLEKKYGIKREHKITRSFVFSDFNINAGDKRLISKQCIENLEYKFCESPPKWGDGDPDKLKEMIDEWFPLEVRDFYFFDGEKLYDLLIKKDVRKKEYISKIILRKSDHYKVGKIIETVDRVAAAFEDVARRSEQRMELVKQSEKEISELEGKLAKEEIKSERLSNDIHGLEETLAKITKEKDQIAPTEERRKARDDNKKRIKEYDTLNKDLAEAYQELGALLGNNSEKIYNFQYVLISDIIKQVYDDIHEKYKAGTIPTKLSQGTYDIILNRNYCICSENELTPDQIEFIKKQRANSVDESLNKAANEFLTFLVKKQKDIKDKKGAIIEARWKVINIKDKRDRLGDRPDNDTESDELFTKYADLLDQIKSCERNLSKKKSDLDDCKSKIKGFEDELNKKKDLELKRKNREGISQLSDFCAYISRKAKNMLECCINDKLNLKIIQYIKDRTNNTFLELIEPKELFDSVYISENWDFGYYQKGRPNEPIVGENGPSKGQHHILGISFLHAISGTTNFNIPILFDTPLGRIDEFHKTNIGKNFLSLFKGAQTILFLTGSEAKDMITHISGKQGWRIKNDRTFAYIEEIKENQLNEEVNKLGEKK